VKKKRSDVALDEAGLLDRIIEDINDELDNEAAARRGSFAEVHEFISTGIVPLDIVLRGGIPLGRIVEIYGKEGSGKSSLAASIMAQCTAMGGVVALLDSEAKFSRERAVRMGVKMDSFFELNADCLEEAFRAIITSVKKIRDTLDDRPVVLIWDTIAAAPLEAETENAEEFKDGMIPRPKIIRKGLRTLARLLTHKRMSLVIVNQLISGPKGSDSPGGGGVKHHATQRIQMWVDKKLSDTAGPYGILVHAQIRKNQIDSAPGFPEIAKTDDITFPVHFFDGPDNIGALADLLLSEDVEGFSRSGAWLKIDVNGKTASCYQKDLYKTVKELDLYGWMIEQAKKVLTGIPRRDLSLC
jgi:recombination protein RecA